MFTKLTTYFKETRLEMKKVNWPTRPETLRYTITVIAVSLGMEDQIFQVIVPKEKKIKIKGGKRRVVEEEIYPGYVLVEMIVTDASWYIVRNTPRVTGFVGSGTTPAPLSKEEIDVLFKRMGKDEPVHKIDIS